MPDFTMCCPSDGCERRNECYRYRAIPARYQSYAYHVCEKDFDKFYPIPNEASLMANDWQEAS